MHVKIINDLHFVCTILIPMRSNLCIHMPRIENRGFTFVYVVLGSLFLMMTVLFQQADEHLLIRLHA